MSLVITIIIMLILAGVVLSLTLGNNGIFKTAKMAAENYTNAQEKELAELGQFSNSITDYLGNNGDKQLDPNNATISDLVNKINNLQNEITTLKTSNIEQIYPVGSIYMSTELSTPEQVSEKFGGTWESYGVGRTIVGAGTGYNVGATGGSNTVKLSESNLPSHSHYIPALSGTASNVSLKGNWYHVATLWSDAKGICRLNLESGNYTGGSVAGEITKGGRLYIDASHSHTVTTNASETGKTGDGTDINIQNPYIITYMWKRIS